MDITIYVAKKKPLISCTVIAQIFAPLFSHMQQAAFLHRSDNEIGPGPAENNLNLAQALFDQDSSLPRQFTEIPLTNFEELKKIQ